MDKRTEGSFSHRRERSAGLIIFLCLALGVALLAAAGEARAALGEPVGSIATDRESLLAVRHATTTHTGYSIHEFASDGTMVREYVSPSGIVFGIAWNGLAHPDLRPLLGAYAGEYEAALQQAPRKPGPRRHETLQTGRVVVEKWGHMRNLQGRAYAPALIPPGVTADEIR